MIRIAISSKWLGILAVAGLGVTGCAGHGGGNQPGAPVPQSHAKLEVRNRSSTDMDIFLVRSGERVRLGLAPGNETTNFDLLPAQLTGVGPVHFEAVPLAGLGRSISSEPISLGLNDVISLDIPPF